MNDKKIKIRDYFIIKINIQKDTPCKFAGVSLMIMITYKSNSGITEE